MCDERDGWCLPHTADELRNLISNMIQKHIDVKPPGKTRQHTVCADTWNESWIFVILCGFVVASSTPKTRRDKPKTVDSGEDEDDDDDDNEDYKPSDESDNEMETELADYI